MVAFYCERCGKCINRFSTFLRHLRMLHSFEPNFSVKCTIQNSSCCKIFSNLEAYKTHMFRCHRSYYEDKHTSLNINVSYKITCPICLQNTDNLIKLSSHFEQHCAGARNYVCY